MILSAMIYHNEKTYLEYIKNNVDNINDFTQNVFNWKTYANKKTIPIIVEAERYLEFGRVVKDMSDKLNREQVAYYYKEDIYKGFIATLLWGGMHKGRYNKAEDNNFFRVLSVNKEDVVSRIVKIKSLLSNNIRGAFLASKNEDNHIKGIGDSYWTKIMYFLKYDDYSGLKPLIFDSIMQKVHCAILIDTIGDKVKDWYYLDNKNNLCLKKPSDDAYMDYIERMKQLSDKFGIEKVDNLEAALFGWRSRHTYKNPRCVVKKHIEKHKGMLNRGFN